MITDPPAPEPAGTSRRWSGLLRVMTARPRRAGLGEHMRTLSIGGHLELATDAERMAPIVEAFLTAERSPS